MTKWPDHFDLNDDPETGAVIRRFIEAQLDELKEFDQKREQWVKANMPPGYHMTYRFYDHTLRVSEDVKKTAQYLGLPDHACENLYWAMLPHDIGKKLLPVNIWDTIEKPEDEIKTLRRSHTELGTKIVKQKLDIDHPFIDLMLDIMLNHHEQMDGCGYRGLKAAELSLPVRLAAIVEGFDGWKTRRPHFGKRDITVPGVLKRMREEKGANFFDMKIFEAFAEMKMEEYKKAI